MKIGVIGIGDMGGTLALKWSGRGHQLSVANSRGAAAARAIADEIGAEAVDIRGAVEGADVVVLSLPFPALATLPKDLFDGEPDGLPIVDTSNYYPDVRDARILEIDAGLTEGVWASRQLGRPLFKAFNSLMFHTLSELGRPPGSRGRLAVPVAGDDPAGKALVMGLVDEAGFDPVDAGLLEDSWRQQPSTPAYCCDYDAAMTSRGLQAAVKGRAATIRDTLWREGYGRLFASQPTFAEAHRDVIAMNRSFNPL